MCLSSLIKWCVHHAFVSTSPVSSIWVVLKMHVLEACWTRGDACHQQLLVCSTFGQNWSDVSLHSCVTSHLRGSATINYFYQIFTKYPGFHADRRPMVVSFSSVDHASQFVIVLSLSTGERGAKGEKGDTGVGQRGEIGPPGIPGVFIQNISQNTSLGTTARTQISAILARWSCTQYVIHNALQKGAQREGIYH